jgi:hypothetical protein
MSLQFLDDEPVVESMPAPQPAPVFIPQPMVAVQPSPSIDVWQVRRRSFILGVIAAVVVMFAYANWDRRGSDDDDVDPITDKGYRALVIYENDNLKNYTQGQINALNSIQVRKWLDANCAKDGEANGYTLADVDTPLDKLSPSLQAMRTLAKPPYPCVVIANPPKRTVVEEIRGDFDPARLIETLERHK